MGIKRITLFRRIGFLLRNRPFDIVRNSFVTLGILWAIVEPTLALIPKSEELFSGWTRFAILISVSILVGFVYSVPRLKIRVRLRQFNTTIVLEFGDLFSKDGILTIPVSQFIFETNVIPGSLQMQVIDLFTAGKEKPDSYEEYFEMLDQALERTYFVEINREGTTLFDKRQYPLGTNLVLPYNGEPRFLFFALTKTELEKFIPKPPLKNCDLQTLDSVSRKLFSYFQKKDHNNSLNLPLLGSGVTGISPSDPKFLLLRMLQSIYSFIATEGKITSKEIRIILHPSYFEDIDLVEISQLYS